MSALEQALKAAPYRIGSLEDFYQPSYARHLAPYRIGSLEEQ